MAKLVLDNLRIDYFNNYGRQKIGHIYYYIKAINRGVIDVRTMDSK